MKFDPIWLSALSDLFINLSAGWLGTVIILPNYVKERGMKKILILISNLIASIVSLGIGVYFRKVV